MVDLGRGQRAPLSEVLSMHDPGCRYCTGGWQRYHEGPQERQRLCGCAVRRMRRKLQGETPSTPAVVVTKNPALEAERQEKRRQRLTAHLAKLDGDLAKVRAEYQGLIQGHDAGVREAESLASGRAVVVEIAQDRLNYAKRAVEKVESELEAMQLLAAEREVAVAEATQKRRDAETALEAARANSAAVLESAAKVQHRAERLAAKIAAIRAQHPELS
jgi:chromosome segregation ATPase